jgi:hypothetical protein
MKNALKNALHGFGLALAALLLTVVVLECALRVARPAKYRAVSVNVWGTNTQRPAWLRASRWCESAEGQ